MFIYKLFNGNEGVRKGAKYWREEAEEYRDRYVRKELSDQAWSHALLQAVIAGKITPEAYKMITNLHKNEIDQLSKHH